MNKFKKIKIFFPVFLFLSFLIFPSLVLAGKLTALATTFPIYQIARNVTNNGKTLQLRLMLPSQLGCPHDYALTPQDMQKLAQADILIINGLGMEEFLGAPLKKANEHITVIDSSAGIEETLTYTCTEDAEHESHDHGHDNDENAEHGHDHHGHGHDHAHCHHHHGANPHLFASPRMVAKLAINIATQLAEIDPASADLYTENANVYAKKMNALADEMAALGKRLQNNRIVEPHGVFDYLARDMHLEIVAVMLPHGQEPSAYGLRHLAQTIKEKQAGAIFTEPQYPAKVGNLLAKETGLPVAVLDPGATGPNDAPLDYYETLMRQNMKVFEQTLAKN